MLKTQEMRFQHSQKLFIVAPRRFGGAFHLLLRFGRIFFDMLFNCREALRTDIVFDPARVIESCLLIDTEIHQPFGEGSVALIDRLCDPAAFVGQCDMSLVIYQDQVIDPEILHCDADAGFGEAELRCDIDRTHIRLFFA